MEKIELRKPVRKYFEAKSKIDTILIIVGIVLCITVVLSFLGVLLILLGILGIGSIFFADYSGQEDADQATVYEIQRLRRRAIDRLQVTNEEIGLIEPVFLTGFGDTPDGQLGSSLSDFGIKKKRGFFGFFKKKMLNVDPVELYRIGSDDVLRSMLLQVTVYAFTEDQLLIYIGNVDISTGQIYEEQTAEVFYSDVNGIDTSEILTKILNRKKKKFNYYHKEYITIFCSGVKYLASYRNMDNDTPIDEQFAGMRNLIRQKKMG